MSRGLIVLDRDGVLNRMLGAGASLDSPLRADEVSVFPWVAGVLRALSDAGYGLVVATNQPAWAKGKTTREDLEEVHRRVLAEAERGGAHILSSHTCWHRAEDGCACRKPRVGLLEEAFARNPGYDRDASWMVGDRATDVLAGAAFGLKTALVGALRDDELRALQRAAGAPGAAPVLPSFCGIDLRDFAGFLLG